MFDRLFISTNVDMKEDAMSWLKRGNRKHQAMTAGVQFCDDRSEVCDSACRANAHRDAMVQGVIRMTGNYPRVV